MAYEREKEGMLLQFGGMNLLLSPDRMPATKYPFAQNVRAYKEIGIKGRTTQDSSVAALPFTPHTIRRLNDLTPNGPAAGFVLISGAGNFVYANSIQADSGYSGNPLSFVPFRPNTSVQPWMYIGDSVKMAKVRSDGTAYKMGIKEPQLAPVVQFVAASDTVSLLGDVTVYYYNNPVAAHNPPLQAVYLWHNPTDKGPSNLIETIAGANGSNTGNSLQFDKGLNVAGANPVAWGQYTNYLGTVTVAGTAVTWDSGTQFGGLANGNTIVINGVTYTIVGTPTNTTMVITPSGGTQTAVNYSAAVLSGTVPLFAPQMESEGYQDFNCSILGTFFVPAAGTYTFTVTCKDDFIWGIGNSPNGNASWPARNPGIGETYGTYGQTKTTIDAYRLMPRIKEANGNSGNVSTASVNVTFTAPGNYPFEVDWDYWYHNPRGLLVQCNGIDIPPIPPSTITDSQYRYTYRSSATGAVSNPSPESPESPLSVISNLVNVLFSTDPQVDKIDIYRLDAGLTNFTYAGTIGNSSFSTTLLGPVSNINVPYSVQVGSLAGIFAGSLVTVDVGATAENVTILSTSIVMPTTTVTAWAYGSLSGFVLYTVTSSTGINVGDVVSIIGLPYTGVGPNPNGIFTVFFTDPTHVQIRLSQSYHGNFGSTGDNGTMTDESSQTLYITAVFTQFHLTGALVVTIGGQFPDTLLDSDISGNPILEFDNFEPFPSIDLPRKGTVNVFSVDSGAGVFNLVNWASGDQFNVRWLPGTVIIIGTTAFTLTTRPFSNLTLTAQNIDTVGGIETVVFPPAGSGLAYEIDEPILAAQPLPYLWGPTDNVPFAYGCGDPLRPGTLYWSKGSNLDSAPDTNQLDVTSPSEPLQNGCMVGGFGMVFSTERSWFIWPNYFNALATVVGTVGATWTLQEASTERGLYIPRALATDGFGKVYFRAKDGIYETTAGGAEKYISQDIYNVFPHEGSVPEPIRRAGNIVFPPDDTQPQKQKLACATGYLYYDYVDLNGNPRTLVYDIAAQGWVWDVYQFPATVHALEEGPNVNGVLVGSTDGRIRPLTSQGSEVTNAIVLMPSYLGADTRAQKHWGDIYIELRS